MNGPSPDRRRLLRAVLAAGAAGIAPRGAFASHDPVSPARAFASSFEPAVESLGPTRVRFDRPLPKGLAGRLLRCGPARLRRGDTVHDHWFDGDGMVQSFDLEGGHLRHLGRMVRTSRYVAEEAAGRFEWPSYATARPAGRAVRTPDDINAANTSVLPLGDQVLALWEGGSPWRLDARTLETLGRRALPGAADGLPFSAHPRRDERGRLWNFGYAAGSDRLVLHEMDARGAPVRTATVDAPGADSVHDFALTGRFLAFVVPPLRRAEPPHGPDTSPLDRLRWEGGEPTVVLLVDRRTLRVAHRFALEPFFAFHLGNAWDDGEGAVRLEVARAPDFGPLMDAVRAATRGEPAPALARPHAVDVVLDLRAGTAAAEALPVRGLEFPAHDLRRTGRRTASLWGLARNASMPAGAFGHNELVGLRRDAGTVDRFDFGSGTIAEEHVHAPGRDGRDWLLGTAYDWGANRTSLAVFDARDVSAGPVSVATLPYALPLGLHGHFTPA